ncbi:unnamed protein product [Vicia faba]|uniref:Uncharacterized protein n=1 Tax=Vicia faba TaxID=3906 RepID=A0AAV1AFJ0_VICFA|nr:unnamed protein product [Vicia faba]
MLYFMMSKQRINLPFILFNYLRDSIRKTRTTALPKKRIGDVQMVIERKEERERVRYVELIAGKQREAGEQAQLAEARSARLKAEEEAKAAEAANDAEEKGKQQDLMKRRKTGDEKPPHRNVGLSEFIV